VLLSPYNYIVILKIRILSALINIYVITLYFNLESRRVSTFFNLEDLILK